MSFFTNIPAVLFWNKVAPNIMSRVALNPDAVNNAAIYHSYTIEDGDRPDTLAYYYYGNPDYDWLIMIANNIFDLTSQWPLTTNEFDTYMTNKYGDIYSTYGTVDHYELAPNIVNISTNDYSGLSVAEQKYWAWNDYQKAFIFIAYTYSPEISVAAYDALTIGEQSYWTSVSIYDAEYAINEAKRNIKLIDRSYSTQLATALQEAMSS